MQLEISLEEFKELIKECIREVINEPKKVVTKPRKEKEITNNPNEILSMNILAFLNYRCDKNFTITSKTHLTWINGRIFTDKDISPNQAIGIINQKADEWIGNESMEQYLRPSTLFNKTKCNEYLGNLKHLYRYKTSEEALKCISLLQSKILTNEELSTLRVSKDSIINTDSNIGEFY